MRHVLFTLFHRPRDPRLLLAFLNLRYLNQSRFEKPCHATSVRSQDITRRHLGGDGQSLREKSGERISVKGGEGGLTG